MNSVNNILPFLGIRSKLCGILSRIATALSILKSHGKLSRMKGILRTNHCRRINNAVPIESIPQMVCAKTRKATLLGLFFYVPLGYTLLAHQ